MLTREVMLSATHAMPKNTTKKCKMGTSFPVNTYRLDLTKGTAVSSVLAVISGAVDASPSLAYDLNKKNQELWLYFSVKAKPSLKTSRTKR